jgi:hypothetical protein
MIIPLQGNFGNRGPLSCGVFTGRVCAGHLVNYFSEFSDEGSLKVPKLLACYAFA